MKIKHKTKEINVSRRRLLSGVVGIGAAGAGISAFGVTRTQQAGAADGSGHAASSGEYRETEHIRRYYQTAW